jgi:hypothetical protein
MGNGAGAARIDAETASSREIPGGGDYVNDLIKKATFAFSRTAFSNRAVGCTCATGAAPHTVPHLGDFTGPGAAYTHPICRVDPRDGPRCAWGGHREWQSALKISETSRPRAA